MAGSGLLNRAVFSVVGEMTVSDFYDLLTPKGHAPLFERRRASVINTRTKMAAMAFAILTPTWTIVDFFMFQWPLWGWLVGIRLSATAIFAYVAWGRPKADKIEDARIDLAILLITPVIFFAATSYLFSHYPVDGMAQLISMGYALLPFVMIAGMGIFPVTAIEGGLLAAPMLGSMVIIAFMDVPLGPFSSAIGALWLLTLLATVATFSAMSQLHFMNKLVASASHDLLTRAYVRRVGEEMVEMQFDLAKRNNQNLAVAFIDLDKFKSVNDVFGHEEGDNTLRKAAGVLREELRKTDVLIRWGGEEFLILMLQTDGEGARKPLERLLSLGLGERPDEQKQTASIGMAERAEDEMETWGELVELADQRMYKAKTTGRNRAYVCGEELMMPESGLEAPKVS